MQAHLPGIYCREEVASQPRQQQKRRGTDRHEGQREGQAVVQRAAQQLVVAVANRREAALEAALESPDTGCGAAPARRSGTCLCSQYFASVGTSVRDST